MDEKLYRMDGNSVSPVSYSFFDTEDKLQALIAENPDLLLHELYSTEDISAGRRLFLIGREIGLRKSADDSTSMWLDVLFVDDSGLPVLVEVKRSVNPEIHRLVVAQLINYATFARLWNKSLLQNGFRQNNRADVLAEYDTDSFWDTVLTHLREETYTMVVAADKINGELAEMLAFLDRKIPDITVCGVEVNAYEGLCTTRFIGNRALQATKAARSYKEWDATSLLAKCNEVRPDFAACTEKLVNYALGCGLPVHYGRGMIYASMDVSINGAWLYQIQSLDHDIGVFVSYANLSSKLGGALSPEQILEMFSPLGRDGHPLSYSMLYIKLRVSDLAAGDNLSVFLSQCDRILNIYREHSKSLIPPRFTPLKRKSSLPNRVGCSFLFQFCDATTLHLYGFTFNDIYLHFVPFCFFYFHTIDSRDLSPLRQQDFLHLRRRIWPLLREPRVQSVDGFAV